MKTVDELKFIIFSEGRTSPLGGEAAVYYCDYGEDLENISWMFSEASEHVGYLVENADEEYREEYAEMLERAQKADTEFWKDLSYDDGFAFLRTECYAEGEDILQTALDFLNRIFPYYQDEDDDLVTIVNKAKENPEDISALDSLIEAIQRIIDINNKNY